MPDNSVAFNKESAETAIGIDLGGTKIAAALVRENRLVGDPIKVPTPQGADNILKELVNIVSNFQKDSRIAGVGIATAGIVNPHTGQVIGSTGNLPGWEGTGIRKLIEEKASVRTIVENDANAAAFGEYSASPNLKDKTCIVTVTLGTGIGVGIVIQGNLYRGAHFAAGECGHIKISMDNRRRCTCDLWDCWEAYGSGRGMLATGWEMLDGLKESDTPLVSKRDHLKTQDIIEAARSGDQYARKAVDKWHEHVACGLVTLCHTLDPDVFVLSGGMSKFVDYALLRELVSERTLPRVSEKLEIHSSVVGEAAGMVGAAALVIQAMQLQSVR